MRAYLKTEVPVSTKGCIQEGAILIPTYYSVVARHLLRLYSNNEIGVGLQTESSLNNCRPPVLR